MKIGTGRAIHSTLKLPHKSETWVVFKSDNLHFLTLMYICQIVHCESTGLHCCCYLNDFHGGVYGLRFRLTGSEF